MMDVRSEISNLAQVNAQLVQLAASVESLRPLWERFGEEFYAQEVALFNAAPWAPLSESYAREKQKRFGSKSLLRATDVLFRSLTEQGAEGNIHQIRDLGAEFGSSDFKAALHQSGTSVMPARPPLADPDVEKYETIAAEYMSEVLSNAGFS